MLHLFFGEHTAQVGPARRVAYHARTAAHEGDGLMAAALHVRHCHDGNVVSYVQRIGGRVETDVERDGLAAPEQFV